MWIKGGLFLSPTSFSEVIHKWTGNIGPTVALKLKGSGYAVPAEHGGLMKFLPRPFPPGGMNSLQAEMEGFTQMLAVIYCISSPRTAEDCFHISVSLNVLSLLNLTKGHLLIF